MRSRLFVTLAATAENRLPRSSAASVARCESVAPCGASASSEGGGAWHTRRRSGWAEAARTRYGVRGGTDSAARVSNGKSRSVSPSVTCRTPEPSRTNMKTAVERCSFQGSAPGEIDAGQAIIWTDDASVAVEKSGQAAKPEGGTPETRGSSRLLLSQDGHRFSSSNAVSFPGAGALRDRQTSRVLAAEQVEVAGTSARQE
ncbi:hypothetical protein TGVAND_227875, partial [Toxoplasma gondii VAND]